MEEVAARVERVGLVMQLAVPDGDPFLVLGDDADLLEAGVIPPLVVAAKGRTRISMPLFNPETGSP